MTKIARFKIEGMHCEGCIDNVTDKLKKIDGITGIRIDDWKSGNADLIVEKDVAPEQIKNAISKAGYKVSGQVLYENYDSDRFDLIIIGGGSAAFAAAIKASELGKRILIINDGLPIGGTCVNVGCVPSKTLIRTAEAFYHSNHSNFSGIKPGKSEIDFKEVIAQKRELVENLRQKKYIDVISDDPNITVMKGHAKLTGKNEVTSNGKTYSAEIILIATGSSTFVPDIAGLEQSGYYTNDTLYELEKLPEHLVIIGGRYIALENAQLFRRLGSKVTILQRSARILPTETADITETLSRYLREEGIEIKTGVKIHSIEKNKDKVFVKIDIEGKTETVEGTHLLVATGRKGNTEKGMLAESICLFTLPPTPVRLPSETPSAKRSKKKIIRCCHG